MADVNNNPRSSLRNLQPSERFFWKETLSEQLSQKVIDQNADYGKRLLPENEVTALAFNEIAAKYRQGFCFHTPSRSAWTTAADEERLPSERTPGAPGSQYPTLLYMDFNWNEHTHAKFISEPQRGRYLKCSAISNPPGDETPLYAIQYAVQRCPVFDTPQASLIIFATESGYYLLSTTAAAATLGYDKKDPSKLGSANWLWDRASLDKGRDRDQRKERDTAMSPYKLADLEEVYLAIVQQCSEVGNLDATLTPRLLRDLIPRPDPDQASRTGSALGDGLSADPSTRRGEKHRFAPRKRLKLDHEQTSDATNVDGESASEIRSVRYD